MRVSECFEVKRKGIMEAEVDLSLNYMYYLRNGLIYGWGNYVFRGGRREKRSICLFFHIFWETDWHSKFQAILWKIARWKGRLSLNRICIFSLFIPECCFWLSAYQEMLTNLLCVKLGSMVTGTSTEWKVQQGSPCLQLSRQAGQITSPSSAVSTIKEVVRTTQLYDTLWGLHTTRKPQGCYMLLCAFVILKQQLLLTVE